MLVLWGVPAVAEILAAEPARFVKEKFAGAATPATVAVTVNTPAVLLAVNTAAVATPCALVVAVFTPPANVPLAPLVGAVNVTVTPLAGLLEASVTVTCSNVAKGWPTTALCGVPPVAAMFAGAPARLVKEKLAGVETPAAVAVTV